MSRLMSVGVAVVGQDAEDQHGGRNKMERVQIINEISTFLEKSREDLYQILDKIGWDKEGLEKVCYFLMIQ